MWLAERRTELATTQVALKFSLDEHLSLQTVKQEAEVWVKASGHPNVLPIIEANIYDGNVVIVSEYAPDGSLEELLKKHSALSPRKAAEMTIGILSGLEFLHSRQIIHRDIKPANILLQGNTPRVSDFGVSRLVHTSALTSTVAGTPKYMAPEVFDGRRNVQTDIWAVGVMFYQMLTGRFPYPQEDTTELIGALVLREPEPLPQSFPHALRNIIMRALAKNPAQRYQTAEQMRQDLFQIFASLSDVLTDHNFQVVSQTEPARITPFELADATERLNATTNQTLVRQQPKKKSSVAAWIAGGLFAFALLLGGIGTVFYYVVKNISNTLSAYPDSSPATEKGPFSTKTNPAENPEEFDEEAIYYSADRIRGVLAEMEKEAGGKLKLMTFNIFGNYVVSKMKDPSIDDNFDTYTYRDGAITKKPERISIEVEKKAIFSVSDVNWEAIPGLVKTANEKAKNLEGRKNPIVLVRRDFDIIKEIPTDIEIYISVSGSRKSFSIEADAKGNVKKEKFD